MDFVNKAISSVTPSAEEHKPETKAATEPPKEATEPSAVAGAVTGAKETAGVGFGKVAGATGDLLSSVKEYGKLDETKGVGKVVDQAEDYVRTFEKPAAGEKKEGEEGGGVGGFVKSAGGFFK